MGKQVCDQCNFVSVLISLMLLIEFIQVGDGKFLLTLAVVLKEDLQQGQFLSCFTILCYGPQMWYFYNPLRERTKIIALLHVITITVMGMMTLFLCPYV